MLRTVCGLEHRKHPLRGSHPASGPAVEVGRKTQGPELITGEHHASDELSGPFDEVSGDGRGIVELAGNVLR